MRNIKSSNKNLVILASFIAALSVFGCAKREPDKNESNAVIPVEAERVELKDLSLILEYVGDIKARDEVRVFPKVSGKIMEKIKEDGSPVAKGEAIAYIDRDEVGLKFEKAPVESPLTGIVGRVYVDVGASVTAQTPVALVIDMDEVKIELDVPEKYLPQISLGGEAKISTDAYPEEEFIGKVTKISPVVDLASRSAPVTITLDNPGHLLKSGMFARVNLIIAEHKNVPVILKEAIIGKYPEQYVYVAENQKAALKKVSLGLRQGPYWEVISGLKVGDLVVIMGQQRLYDNAPVSIEDRNTEGLQ